MARSGKIIINKVEKKSTNKQSRATEVRINTAATGSSNQHHQQQQQRIKLIQKFEFLLTLLNRLLIGFVTIYMCWMCLHLPAEEIPWHALLCTVGFVCLMAEGLMAHYRGNAWTQLCYRPEKTRTHWILQLLGSVIGLTGIVIKIRLENVHFHTLHGCFGLTTTVLLCLSLASGLSSLYANELKQRMQPLLNKSSHCVLGLCTFICAMLSMFTAYETDIFFEHSLDAANYLNFHILLQFMIVAILILSGYGPLWCLIYSKLWKCC